MQAGKLTNKLLAAILMFAAPISASAAVRPNVAVPTSMSAAAVQGMDSEGMDATTMAAIGVGSIALLALIYGLFIVEDNDTDRNLSRG